MPERAEPAFPAPRPSLRPVGSAPARRPPSTRDVGACHVFPGGCCVSGRRAEARRGGDVLRPWPTALRGSHPVRLPT